MKKAIPSILLNSGDPPKIPIDIPSGSLDVDFRLAFDRSSLDLQFLSSDFTPRTSKAYEESPFLTGMPRTSKTENVVPWEFQESPNLEEAPEIKRMSIYQESKKMKPKVKSLSITTQSEELKQTQSRRGDDLKSPLTSNRPPNSRTDSDSSIIPSLFKGFSSFVMKEEKSRRIIKIFDENDNSVMVDISNLIDAKSIRDKIHQKLSTSIASNFEYQLYIKTPIKTQIIDDLLLVDICTNVEHPDRNYILLKKINIEEELDVVSNSVAANQSRSKSPSRKTSFLKVFSQPKDEKMKKCIKITDLTGNYFWIDVSGISNESRTIREKIGFKLAGNSDYQDFELLIRNGDSPDIIINDDLLIDICSNPEHVFRNSILANFDKTARHTDFSKSPLEPGIETFVPELKRGARATSFKSAKGNGYFKQISAGLGLNTDAFFDESLRKCIRVFDINDNSFSIDVSTVLNDANAIRTCINNKVIEFDTSINAEDVKEFRIYLKKPYGDCSLDDLTLIDVCSNPGHPDRSNLVVEKKRKSKEKLSRNNTALKSSPESPTWPNFIQKMTFKDEQRSLKTKCIRVYDTSDNSFLIDISNIHSDASALRARIMMKMCSSPDKTSQEEYEVYIRAQSFETTRFIRDDSIDDLTLVEICSNPDHPYRNHLVFDKKRHPKVKTSNTKRRRKARKPIQQSDIKYSDLEEALKGTEDAAPLQVEDKLDKLHDFFGESIPEKVSRSKQSIRTELEPDLEEDEQNHLSKEAEIFDQRIQTQKKKEKLKNFFGEDDLSSDPKKKKAINRKASMERRLQNLGILQSSKKPVYYEAVVPSIKPSGSKKLENFFGDRPPQQLIAQNLDVFFPGLQQTAFQNALKESEKNKRSSRFQFQEQKKELMELKRQGVLRHSAISLSFSAPESNENSLTSINDKSSFLDHGPNTVDKSENDSKSLDTVLTRALSDSNVVSKSLEIPKLDNPQRTPSLIDFMEAFSIEPDMPKQIKWIQGPLIGSGSFGKVFYGANCETAEIMAVKQVPIRSSGGDQKLRKKMLHALHMEIQLLKDLNNENVVRYLGYCVEGNMINVFLEYVSGGSVTSALALMGAFDEVLVKSITNQVLHGLAYLHAKLIIHRDIKGGNILIDDDGWAKISDFGISKRNVHSMAYQRNSTMSVQGTVYWMAPEVLKNKGYSAKVDIWSLGCVILEMLSCRHPWQNFDEIQTLWRLGRFDRPPMPEKISKEAENFLNATFAISPDERPSALELMDHEFCIYDVENFDFRAYKEAAIIRKRELDEKEEEEEEDSEDDEGIFTKLTIDDSEEDYEVNADEVQSEINPVSS